jgi:hypothetical protein
MAIGSAWFGMVLVIWFGYMHGMHGFYVIFNEDLQLSWLVVCSLAWIFVALADDFHVPAWKSSWFAVGSLPMAEWCLRELSLYMVSAWFELIQRGPFVPMCMSCCLLLSAGGRWLVGLHGLAWYGLVSS